MAQFAVLLVGIPSLLSSWYRYYYVVIEFAVLFYSVDVIVIVRDDAGEK